MAFITGKTVQGNCGPVTYENGRYRCFPIPDVPGTDMDAVQQILFYVRIEGRVGEVVPIDLQWPRFDAEKAGPRKYKTKTFFPPGTAVPVLEHRPAALAPDRKLDR